MDPPSPRKSYAVLKVPNRPKAVKPTSPTPRNVTEFLEQKIVDLTIARNSIISKRDKLVENKKSMEPEIFQNELRCILAKLAPNSSNLQALSKSKRAIEQDITEEIETNKASQKPRERGPGLQFFERAYANSIVPRVMGSTGKQGKQWNRHDQRLFRDEVLNSYDAVDGGIAYCSVYGSWFSKADITAAHLVPRTLSEEDVSFLFGANQKTSSNPKNGVALHKAIATAIYTGRLVIVPILPLGSNQWRTVLVDQTKGHLTAFQTAGSHPQQILWRDLHHRELKFRSSFRPTRRFLYFRFVVTYLHAKAAGNKAFTDSVECKTTFWASGGPYLHQSTLKSLARNISGLDLPENITANTFTDPDISELDAEMAGELAAARVREAAIESFRTETQQDNKNATY